MFDLTLMQWVQVCSALLTPVIACLGVWIAYQQVTTNRGALKEKLFDRRFEVFKDVQIFLGDVLREGAVPDASWQILHSARDRGRFLFGSDVNAYLDEILDRSGKKSLAIIGMQDSSDKDDRKKQIEIKYEHLKWLTKQLNDSFEKFEPYLGFANHK